MTVLLVLSHIFYKYNFKVYLLTFLLFEINRSINLTWAIATDVNALLFGTSLGF